MDLLQDKVALVTGAGRGVGRGIAIAFAQNGAKVAICEVMEDNAKAVAAEIEQAGGQAIVIPTNVRKKDDVYAAVSTTVGEFGGLDILVNNAMTARISLPFMEQTDNDMLEVWEVGVLATFWGMQAAYPHLVERGGGSIINLGSGSGLVGMAGFTAYAGAKEAIRGMSKCVAMEWGANNIRVNTLCPFALSDAMMQWKIDEPAQFEALLQANPLKRGGDPTTDIGAAAVFLASNLSAFVTAATLNVDGGSGSFR